MGDLSRHPCITTLEDSSVVVVPVPYDSTTSFKSGARHGPRAAITASKQLEEWDIELERDVSTVGIYTTQEIEPHTGGPEAMIERVRRVAAHFIAQDKLVALLGGEHTITVGGVTAALERHPGSDRPLPRRTRGPPRRILGEPMESRLRSSTTA